MRHRVAFDLQVKFSFNVFLLLFVVYLFFKWSGLFLNDLKTQQESLVFVKRMMAVAVSSITYLRGIFPEDAYRSRYLEGDHKLPYSPEV